jgi:hypothetical protein
MSENQATTVDPANQLEEADKNQELTKQSIAASDSLLRLVVGGALIGSDELRRRLQAWEQEIADQAIEPSAADDIENRTQYIRTAFIGFLFSTKWQMEGAAPRLLRAADVLLKRSFRPLRSLVGNSAGRRVQSRIDDLEQRGEDRVAQWLAIGLSQEPHARILARNALDEVVDDVIAQLAENPELEALVQQQSVGLASEIVDGVRTQTVTADTMVERSVRKILGRPARPLLAEPDDVEQDGAASPPS